MDDSVGNLSHYLNVAVIAAIASLICSLTLWLLEHPVKYALYIVEVLLITLLCIMLQVRYEVSIRFNFLGKRWLHSTSHVGLLLDIALISLPLLSIGSLTGVFGVENNIQLVSGLALTSLLPGYALLNLTGLSHRFSTLEKLVFSYLLSYSLTALLTFIFSSVFRFPSWALDICMFYLLLGVFSAVKSLRRMVRRTIYSPRRLSSHRSSMDFIVLLVLFLFFFVAINSVFPQFSLLPRTDISRHYMNSRGLVMAPDMIVMSRKEGWFHLFLGYSYELSKAGVVSFQTALMVFNFIPILAFYIMAKEYLKGIDERLPIISTIFYFLFSGLGWIFVFYRKLVTDLPQLTILSHTAYREAYLDTIYPLGFRIRGYLPMNVAFALAFTLIYLVRRTDLSRSNLFALSSFLFASCLLTHFFVGVFLSIFLASYALVASKDGDNAKRILPPLLTGCAIAGLVLLSIPCLFPRFHLFSSFQTSLYQREIVISILLPASFAGICYLLSQRLKLLSTFYKKIKRMAFSITLAVFLLFFLSIAVWLSIANDFRVDYVGEVRFIPWFFYAVRLGIVGILSVTGLYYFLSNHERYSKLEPFVFMAVIAFIGGRIASFINLNFFFIGITEERFLFFIAPACAALASLGLVKFLQPIAREKMLGGKLKKIRNASIVALLVGSFVIWGTTSTLLSIEYASIESSSFAITPDELEAVTFLNRIFEENPYSIILTVTRESYDLVALSAPPDRVLYADTPAYLPINSAENPTFLMQALSTSDKEWTTIPYSRVNHLYLYLNNQDLNKNGYLFQHILSNLSPIFNNSEAMVYEIPYRSHPLLDGDIALVIPFSQPRSGQNYNYAYDVLALQPYNYTMLYDLDQRIEDKEVLILSIDPTMSEQGLKFDGVDDYVEIPHSSSLNITDEISVEAWVKIDVMPGYFSVVAGKFDWRPFQLGVYYDGRAGFAVTNTLDVTGDVRSPRNEISAGVWYHLVGTYDGGAVRIYANGVERGIVSLSGAIKTNDYPVNFGRQQMDDKYYFDGIIDEVRIYNRALSASEITDRYENNKDVQDGLVAKYEFNTGSGNVAYDGSSNANDGTIYGASWVRLGFLRDLEDYLKYARSGCKLIILNTNGYGFFSDILLRRTNDTLSASRITGEGEISIPNIQVPITYAKEDATVTGYYVDDDGEKTLLSVSKPLAEGEITYVNIYPLISALTENIAVRYEIYSMLGKTLEVSGINLGGESVQGETTKVDIQAWFEGAKFNGNVTISTNSILFPLPFDPLLDMATDEMNISNVSSLTLDSYSEAVISVDNAKIDRGQGLYTPITTEGMIKIKLSGENVTLRARINQNTDIQLGGLYEIQLFADKPLNIYARTPCIQVQGESSFYQIEGIVGSGIRAGVNDLNFSGTTSFRVFYSDVDYFLVGPLFKEGTSNYSTSIISWNEWTTLPYLILWALILSPIFVGMLILFRYKIEMRKFQV